VTPEQASRIPSALAARYPPLRLLGEGGFGIVVAASDGAGGGEVALKIYKGGEGEARQRFLREARLAARIRHPNVVGVLDHGEVDGVLYLVSELVPGGDLSKRLAGEGGLGEGATARLARDLLAGLGAIHEAGIVHRDLKPANVLLYPDGSAAVTDFGMGRGGGEQTMTATGQILGTPAYMAPEQFQGLEPTAATDLYALGLILYECACGQRPHPSEGGVGALMTARLAGAHTPLGDRGVADPGLEELVEALLRPGEEERPPDVAAALALLAGGAGSAPDPAPVDVSSLGATGAYAVEPGAAAPRSRRGVVAGGILLVCALGGYLATRAGPSAPASAPSGPAAPGETGAEVVAARDALRKLRLQVRGDDGIRDGTGLTAETATEDARATWTRARTRYQRLVQEGRVRELVARVAAAPFDPESHEDVVDLVRFEALLGPTVLEGFEPLWSPEEAPDLAGFLARSFRIDPVPALWKWPKPKQDPVAWELDRIGRSFGGAWVPVRTWDDMPVLSGQGGKPWYDERVKFQNLDGVVFANPIASVRAELQLLVRKTSEVDRPEAPSEVRFPLRSLRGGDLELVMVLRDVLRNQAVQVEIVGYDERLTWVGFVEPPEGDDGESPYRAPIRLRVEAGRLPRDTREVRVVGMGIQAVRAPNDFMRVGSCYQRLPGPPR
jgi:serine/threonine-protein kinase